MKLLDYRKYLQSQGIPGDSIESKEIRWTKKSFARLRILMNS